MATTKIWSVHGRIGDVIGYAENPDKTANPAYSPAALQALRDVMNYATNDYKSQLRAGDCPGPDGTDQTAL